jgi:hypothetical protein
MDIADQKETKYVIPREEFEPLSLKDPIYAPVETVRCGMRPLGSVAQIPDT